MPSLIDSPPRAPPVKYKAPLGTRWEKEKAAAGNGAFDYPDDAKFVGPWIIGECVGKGASGHVKIAKHRRTGQLAAIKILPIHTSVQPRADLAAQAKSEKQRLGIDREITMMKLMDHPNIMRIYDVYEGDKELYLILEFVEGGELFDFLVNRGKLAPIEALGYFKQIVYGLNYAHTFSIIHRDLKPENILIHSLDPPLIKIADWGMAAFAPPSLQLETSCGSPHYASPEIVNGHRYTGTATDIWSCGVILYALLTGRLPFDDKNVRTLLSKVKTGRYEMPTFIDPIAKDLLARMLVVDVRKRITMPEILAHPWLEGYTPGILYVPAPPVSELAKPLPSAGHIDRDLFQSLCVIWGRYCDPDRIRDDLLSPAGEGTLVKAFYFLLQKHRERAMAEHGILMDDILKSPGKVITKQYSAPKARPRKAFSEVLPELSTHAVRASAVETPRSPSPQRTSARPTLAALQIPLLDRPPSRAHPPSPAGPRPPRARPTSSPTGDRRAHSMSGTSVSYHRYDPQQRLRSGSQTPSASEAADTARAAQQMSEMIASLPHHSLPLAPQRRAVFSVAGLPRGSIAVDSSISQVMKENAASSSIHAPVPVPATPQKILPMLTAPRVQDSELQKRMDQYANMVNSQAADWNATRSPLEQSAGTTQPALGQQDMNIAAKSPGAQESLSEELASSPVRRHEAKSVDDKENMDRHSVTTSVKKPIQGGLGFGPSVPMPAAPLGKEMANLLYFNNGSEKRDRKHTHHRAAPASVLDIGSPNLQKRSTFSMIGSPTLMSPPPASILGSPAVGEFKGWFSNLFHWKVQSYVMYSVDDVVATRNETLRLLESFGVSVLEDQWGMIKCRADDVYDGSSLVQKQMRFRVEVAPMSSYPASGTTPRLSQHPMSPQSGSISALRSRSHIERISGYETVIVLVLEKGSVSTFKVIHQRLKMDWRLDALQSPKGAAISSGTTPSMDHRIVV